MSDQEQGSVEQSRELELGSVLQHGERFLIVEKEPTDAGDTVVRELGDRRLRDAQMFAPCDDCPVPTCDGEVQDGRDSRRRCSEGCLEWLRTYPVAGEDCTTDGCSGEIIEKDAPSGQYRYECSECHSAGGGIKQWREAWWPRAKERLLENVRGESGGE